jgi:hypothetical protein
MDYEPVPHVENRLARKGKRTGRRGGARLQPVNSMTSKAVALSVM